MKKCLFILIFLMIPAFLTAQVFGTGETLRKGKNSVGLNALFPTDGANNKVYLFVHLDHGIGQGCDVDAKVGFTEGETYYGADIEWQLAHRDVFLSFTGGAHKFINFGLDAILNLMLPMGRSSGVYMGSDLDVEFVEKETVTPFWLFIGMNISLGRKTSLLVCLEGAMNTDAANIVSGGVKFDI